MRWKLGQQISSALSRTHIPPDWEFHCQSWNLKSKQPYLGLAQATTSAFHLGASIKPPLLFEELSEGVYKVQKWEYQILNLKLKF